MAGRVYPDLQKLAEKITALGGPVAEGDDDYTKRVKTAYHFCFATGQLLGSLEAYDHKFQRLAVTACCDAAVLAAAAFYVPKKDKKNEEGGGV